MSIELPNYTIQTNADSPHILKKVMLPLFIFISLLTGYFFSNTYTDSTIKTLRVRNDVLENLNNQNLDKITQQKTELSFLKTEKKIKQEAIIKVQNGYKDLIKRENRLKSEINFYKRLLSPSTENKGLRVFEAKIKIHSHKSLSLKVVLVQKLERAKEISGKFEILVLGKENSKSKTIQLNDNDDSNFKFKYFHNISFGFSLPEGFIAEQLVVKLYPTNKKAKTVEYTVDWQSIINEDTNHV
ncbi:MAG: hypothetical protein JKX98_01765 [Alcanivoracaceae bacterium]|nr:hypothetical protein [Alcanivoracaceae bacterium]